jgi:hypothetical protein
VCVCVWGKEGESLYCYSRVESVSSTTLVCGWMEICALISTADLWIGIVSQPRKTSNSGNIQAVCLHQFFAGTSEAGKSIYFFFFSTENVEHLSIFFFSKKKKRTFIFSSSFSGFRCNSFFFKPITKKRKKFFFFNEEGKKPKKYRDERR